MVPFFKKPLPGRSIWEVPAVSGVLFLIGGGPAVPVWWVLVKMKRGLYFLGLHCGFVWKKEDVKNGSGTWVPEL